MAFDNKDLEAEVTQLTMRSNGIALDENGRITFLDASILETIVAGKLSLSYKLTQDTFKLNDFMCSGPNIFYCGAKPKMTLA